jgi:hypothetical protein
MKVQNLSNKEELTAERNLRGLGSPLAGSNPAPTAKSPRSLMDKTRVCGTRDWEFESPRGHGPIAQLAERRYGMSEVVGSNPTGSTKLEN